MRAFLIVLDSVGIGQAPDAADYGDAGAYTLPHLAAATGGIALPTFQSLGLGCIPSLLPGGKPIPGVAAVAAPAASYGAMRERSRGKDTTTGHWEIAGLHLREGFHLFPAGPPAFPDALIKTFERETGRGTLGHKAASGTRIIEELGARHMESGDWIVYTSADSVMQIAAHEAVIPLEELYRGCAVARRLCDRYPVGRVIARPFVGKPGSFTRTRNRRDFSFPPPEPTILDRLQAGGVHTVTVGKLDDIFANRGIDEAQHVEDTAGAQALMDRLVARPESMFVFANFIDFDMLYGHRRDAAGYAAALAQTDEWLAGFLPKLTDDDVLILTADHGNDPTFAGTDHTREYVPLLVRRGNRPGRGLGIRDGFFDVAQSLAAFFGIEPGPRGKSFLTR